MAGRPRKSSSRSDSPSLFDDEPTPPVSGPIPDGFPNPSAWASALDSTFARPGFAELQSFLQSERATGDVFPPEADVYRAFQATPLESVRVVILGQDPYPTPGHAHGLCFSVRPGVAIPASLRNIYRELQDDLGIPPAKHGFLLSWANQGVFLLNAVLTVRSGQPASHANRGWETFTDAALQAVNQLPRPVVFLLWGTYAQKKVKSIDASRHIILKSAHPSPLSASNGFFGSRPFSQINTALEKLGDRPIVWQLPESVRDE